MTPSQQDIEQYRPGFEAWARGEECNLDRDQSGNYVSGYMKQAWRVWLGCKRESVSGSSTSTSQGDLRQTQAETAGASQASESAETRMDSGFVAGAGIDFGAAPGDVLDAATRAALSEVLNTTLWLYRRLPHAYNKPPFVDHAILTMAKYLGMEHVPESIKERAAIAASTAQEKEE